MGTIIKIPSLLLYELSGIIGIIMSVVIINQYFGVIGTILAIAAAPLTLIFTPWYELLKHSNVIPLVIIYGGMITASLFYGLSRIYDRR